MRSDGDNFGLVYRYCDEGGRHLYDVVRFEPKDFRQRRADRTWKMDGVRRVVYRLPEMQGKSVVYIPEGEKDVDRLRASVPSQKSVGIRPALHPGWRRCSSLKYSRYSHSSRLAIRAHRRPRCSTHF
jgi:hypothetical protein